MWHISSPIKYSMIASLIIMIIAGIVGLFAGAFFNEAIGGATLFSVVAGIACVIYAIDNRNE